MSVSNVTLAMILAQAQALKLVLGDVTTGECVDCQCAVCVTMRGLAQAVNS